MIGEGATSVEKWLSPEPSALQRVRAEVAAALAKVPRVRRIALFGSLAEDRADRWSDIDMFVACEGGQAARWAAAGAIRAAKPVLYYQMFSTAEQPSGRYWFEGESVFHKLDVTFLSFDKYEAQCRDGLLLGHPIVTREVHATEANDGGRGAAVGGDEAPVVQAGILEIGQREAQIRTQHVPLINSLHSRLRGRDMFPGSSVELGAKAWALRQSLHGVGRDTVMSGGRIGVLAWQLVEMAEHLLRVAGEPL